MEPVKLTTSFTLSSVPIAKNNVDRSVKNLHKRMDGHRSKFYEITDGRSVDITSDEYSLGLHLVDHG